MNKNIILIGMPASGKSTIGVNLAKSLGMSFIDTDLIIQKNEKRLLQDIINKEGLKKFLITEEKALLSVATKNSVISTGGSAVFSEKGMLNLKENGIVVFLNVKLNEISTRLKNIKTRGIAMSNDKTIDDIYSERLPLYLKYADIVIDCNELSEEEIIEQIYDELGK